MTDFSTFYGVYTRTNGKTCAQKTDNSATRFYDKPTAHSAGENRLRRVA